LTASLTAAVTASLSASPNPSRIWSSRSSWWASVFRCRPLMSVEGRPPARPRRRPPPAGGGHRRQAGGRLPGGHHGQPPPAGPARLAALGRPAVVRRLGRGPVGVVVVTRPVRSRVVVRAGEAVEQGAD